MDDLPLIDCNIDDDGIVGGCLRDLPSSFNMFVTSIYDIGMLSFDDLVPKLHLEE